MHNYDLELAALTLGQATIETGIFATAAGAVECAAQGGVWSDAFDTCVTPDADRTVGGGGSGGGASSGGASVSTNEILGVVAIAALIGGAVYFWRR